MGGAPTHGLPQRLRQMAIFITCSLASPAKAG
jgi:hypothetical protein